MRNESYTERMGRMGETKFRDFADSSDLPYLWIDQRKGTMPAYLRALVKGNNYRGKRPDAVIADGDDVTLVDVKHYKLLGREGSEHFGLNQKDAKRLNETERRLGKRVMLAYKDNQDPDSPWYGIFLSDALLVGKIKDGPHGTYYSIPKEEFEMLEGRSIPKPRRLF